MWLWRKSIAGKNKVPVWQCQQPPQEPGSSRTRAGSGGEEVREVMRWGGASQTRFTWNEKGKHC